MTAAAGADVSTISSDAAKVEDEQLTTKRSASEASAPPEKVRRTEPPEETVEDLIAAKKRALMEAKRAALERLPLGDEAEKAEEGTADFDAAGEAPVADIDIVSFLKKQSATGHGKVLSETSVARVGVVASAPPVYAKKEAAKELASGDAHAIVAMAGPSTGKAPPAIPGLPGAKPAGKASGAWAWGGSEGGVLFNRPKAPAGHSAGAAAAKMLVRPKAAFGVPRA
mmetsp:Transcript_48796/g.87883  ORF Transcript_48796/g.87883 Transcript_48796/m.87883 type:complete len:226 (-) Transcript_48796:180-857(-)